MYLRHDFCFAKEILSSDGWVFYQLFHSHFLPPRIIIVIICRPLSIPQGCDNHFIAISCPLEL